MDYLIFLRWTKQYIRWTKQYIARLFAKSLSILLLFVHQSILSRIRTWTVAIATCKTTCEILWIIKSHPICNFCNITIAWIFQYHTLGNRQPIVSYKLPCTLSSFHIQTPRKESTT